MKNFITDPRRIEKESMEIISATLEKDYPQDQGYTAQELQIVKRVIHTTADFEYASIMKFHRDPVGAAREAILAGSKIITDTMMVLAGINKRVLQNRGVEIRSLIGDRKIAQEAQERGITRSMVSMEHAVKDKDNGIFVIGNAPTALVRLIELAEKGKISPRVVIAVPVGFVGAAESKELLAQAPFPAIFTCGRKGGSNVAAAIVNAILYMLEERDV